MQAHEEPNMTPGEYREAREALGLSIEQLAYELGVNDLTLRRRECGEVAIRREAQLALRHLVGCPPVERPQAKPHLKGRNFRVGDTFGLFTITEVHKRKNAEGRTMYVLLGIRCKCGKERPLLARNLNRNSICGRRCPARDALAARGSCVDLHGDIIDKDGFPES